MTENIQEIEEQVVKILEGQGVLASLRASLRASVYCAIHEESNEAVQAPKSLQSLRKTHSQNLNLCLMMVRELLVSTGLNKTLSVFEHESLIFSSRNSATDAEELRRAFPMITSHSENNLPFMFGVIDSILSTHNDEQNTNISIQGLPPLFESKEEKEHHHHHHSHHHKHHKHKHHHHKHEQTDTVPPPPPQNEETGEESPKSPPQPRAHVIPNSTSIEIEEEEAGSDEVQPFISSQEFKEEEKDTLPLPPSPNKLKSTQQNEEDSDNSSYDGFVEEEIGSAPDDDDEVDDSFSRGRSDNAEVVVAPPLPPSQLKEEEGTFDSYVQSKEDDGRVVISSNPPSTPPMSPGSDAEEYRPSFQNQEKMMVGSLDKNNTDSDQKTSRLTTELRELEEKENDDDDYDFEDENSSPIRSSYADIHHKVNQPNAAEKPEAAAVLLNESKVEEADVQSEEMAENDNQEEEEEDFEIEVSLRVSDASSADMDILYDVVETVEPISSKSNHHNEDKIKEDTVNHTLDPLLPRVSSLEDEPSFPALSSPSNTLKPLNFHHGMSPTNNTEDLPLGFKHTGDSVTNEAVVHINHDDETEDKDDGDGGDDYDFDVRNPVTPSVEEGTHFLSTDIVKEEEEENGEEEEHEELSLSIDKKEQEESQEQQNEQEEEENDEDNYEDDYEDDFDEDGDKSEVLSVEDDIEEIEVAEDEEEDDYF